MKTFVFVEAVIGSSQEVAKGIKSLSHDRVDTVLCEAVTGPFDVIVTLEADDIVEIGKVITEQIREVPGVLGMITCTGLFE